MGKAEANGFGGAAAEKAVAGDALGGNVELTGTVEPAEREVAALGVSPHGTAETKGKGELAGKRTRSPDEGVAAREAAKDEGISEGTEGISEGTVEKKLAATDGAVEVGGTAVGLGKGDLLPLTTEAKVGATPADIKAERGGGAAQ